MADCNSLVKFFYEESADDNAEHEVSSILKEYKEEYPSFVDRFFSKYYYLKPESPREAYMILYHSNKVCLVCVAPCHPILTQKPEDIKISYNIGHSDRSANKVKGKGKKGGMALQANTTLAIISCNNIYYKVPSCIRSKLIETNAKLTTSAHLLGLEEGYIAIVLPKPENWELIKASLLTQKQYEEAISSENTLK